MPAKCTRCAKENMFVICNLLLVDAVKKMTERVHCTALLSDVIINFDYHLRLTIISYFLTV